MQEEGLTHSHSPCRVEWGGGGGGGRISPFSLSEISPLLSVAKRDFSRERARGEAAPPFPFSPLLDVRPPVASFQDDRRSGGQVYVAGPSM